MADLKIAEGELLQVGAIATEGSTLIVRFEGDPGAAWVRLPLPEEVDVANVSASGKTVQAARIPGWGFEFARAGFAGGRRMVVTASLAVRPRDDAEKAEWIKTAENAPKTEQKAKKAVREF